MKTFTELHDGVPEFKTTVKYEDSKKPKATSIRTENRTEWSISALKALFITVFLPQGYPSSVSDDYLSYQIWDTIQAFASSMTGALATEAVLRGAGVGDKTASALAASLTWLVKDGLGMIGRIAFTYAKGTDLDHNPKKWRLVADILNDLAFCIDLLSPLIPGCFLPFACASSLCRCVVGVAGGATRTAITQHQARRNNLADVAAKDGSQETLVNVAALLTSLIMLPLVHGHTHIIWSLFMLFTIVHLYANYRAVRTLRIRSLNRNRLTIAMDAFVSSYSTDLVPSIPSVFDCNEAEPLFYSLCGTRHLGISLKELYKFAEKNKTEVVEAEGYVLSFDWSGNIGHIALDICTVDLLKPFVHLHFLSKNQSFDDEKYRKLVKILTIMEYDVRTLHLAYGEWRYVVEE